MGTDLAVTSTALSIVSCSAFIDTSVPTSAATTVGALVVGGAAFAAFVSTTVKACSGLSVIGCLVDHGVVSSSPVISCRRSNWNDLSVLASMTDLWDEAIMFIEGRVFIGEVGENKICARCAFPTSILVLVILVFLLLLQLAARLLVMPEEGRLVVDVGGRNDSNGKGGGEEEEVLDEHGFDVWTGIE